MAVFVQGRPITTRVPVIVVDAGMTIGSHRFELAVVDAAGLRSRPDVAVVRIAAGVAGPPNRSDQPLSPRGNRRPR